MRISESAHIGKIVTMPLLKWAIRIILIWKKKMGNSTMMALQCLKMSKLFITWYGIYTKMIPISGNYGLKSN